MSCKNLSPFIAFDDNSVTREYLDELYPIYYKEIANGNLKFKGKPVNVFTELNYELKHQTFEHITTKGNTDRTYNLERCKRILWIRDILSNVCKDCQNYEIIKEVKGKKERYVIWCVQEDYVIVLEKRKDEFFLITAYCVIYDTKRNELKRKAEKQKRQQ